MHFKRVPVFPSSTVVVAFFSIENPLQSRPRRVPTKYRPRCHWEISTAKNHHSSIETGAPGGLVNRPRKPARPSRKLQRRRVALINSIKAEIKLLRRSVRMRIHQQWSVSLIIRVVSLAFVVPRASHLWSPHYAAYRLWVLWLLTRYTYGAVLRDSHVSSTLSTDSQGMPCKSTQLQWQGGTDDRVGYDTRNTLLHDERLHSTYHRGTSSNMFSTFELATDGK